MTQLTEGACLGRTGKGMAGDSILMRFEVALLGVLGCGVPSWTAAVGSGGVAIGAVAAGQIVQRLEVAYGRKSGYKALSSQGCSPALVPGRPEGSNMVMMMMMMILFNV